MVTMTSSQGLSSQSFSCAVGSVYLQKCIYTTACHQWIISKHSKTVTLLKQTPDRLSRPASAFTFQFAHQSLWLSFKALCSISVSGKEKEKKSLGQRIKGELRVFSRLRPTLLLPVQYLPCQPSSGLCSTVVSAFWATRLLQSSSFWNRPKLSVRYKKRRNTKQKNGTS